MMIFRREFRKTPLWRPKRRGILRNAAIILGNHPCTEAIAALEKGVNDAEPLIRGASAWALGRQDGGKAQSILKQRLEVEKDDEVALELKTALGIQGHSQK